MRACWVSRLAALQLQLVAADTAMIAALIELEGYTFDSGEARQTVRYRKIEALERASAAIETRITWVNQKINGGGLVNLNLRRRGYGHRGVF